MNRFRLRVLHALFRPRVCLSLNAFPILAVWVCPRVLQQGAADEVPTEYGFLIAAPDRLQVARYVLKRAMPNLPFALWMARAKAASLNSTTSFSIDGPARSLLLGNEESLDGGQAAAGTGA